MPSRTVVTMVKRIEVLQTECFDGTAEGVETGASVDVECTVNLLDTFPYARWTATRNMSMALIPINGMMMPPTP
jgi:hypothetical protein